MAALAAGAGLAFVGLVVPSLRFLYDYAWFVGFGMSFAVYWTIMPHPAKTRETTDEHR